MNCLLPGDVGSGKTPVAAISLVVAANAGGEEVLYAPIQTQTPCDVFSWALTYKLVALPGQAYCVHGAEGALDARSPRQESSHEQS